MAKKDALNIELEGNLQFQLDYLANYTKSFRRAFHKKYISSNYSMDELAILYLISHRPNITQAALGRYLFKGKAHVGKILNSMEEKGLIKRIYIEHSNNTKSVILKKGYDILSKGNAQIENVKKATLEAFSKEELEIFFLCLKKYKDVLSSFVEVTI